MTLENTINTVATFRTQQMNRIIAAIPQPPPLQESGETPVKQATTCLVHLQTHTVKPLASEADVDQYLGTIKQTLMAKINAGQEVIVD